MLSILPQGLFVKDNAPLSTTKMRNDRTIASALFQFNFRVAGFAKIQGNAVKTEVWRLRLPAADELDPHGL